jgi:hypothetical protein
MFLSKKIKSMRQKVVIPFLKHFFFDTVEKHEHFMGNPMQMLDKMFADSRNPHAPVTRKKKTPF